MKVDIIKIKYFFIVLELIKSIRLFNFFFGDTPSLEREATPAARCPLLKPHHLHIVLCAMALDTVSIVETEVEVE